MNRRAGVPRWGWLFIVATILALSSTFQAYRLTSLGIRPPNSIPIGRLLALNFTLWWVPAALAPLIFRLVDWLSSTGVSWAKSILYHLAGLSIFSVVHFLVLFFVYVAIWWVDGRLSSMPWFSFAQRVYLDNINWTLMTYTSIAAVGYAFNFRRRNHQHALEVAKLETDLVEARLGALAGELQPEFLYGALDTVSRMVHVNPDRADRIISKLADFLRLVLNRTGTIVGPLQDELECLERYIEIEQMRYGSTLSMTMDIDSDTLDAEFPPMALHGLVELLLDHPTEEPLATGLTVRSTHSDERLSVHVSRTLDGIEATAIRHPRSAKRIAAIRDRLRDLYGDEQEVGFNVDEGAAISISVPFRPLMVAAADAHEPRMHTDTHG